MVEEVKVGELETNKDTETVSLTHEEYSELLGGVRYFGDESLINMKKSLELCGDINIINTYNNLVRRRLKLDNVIDEESTSSLIELIMQYNSDDIDVPIKDRTPIIIYVNTEGGCVTSGFSLIDVIQSSETPIKTVNMGNSFSMGSLIVASGHERYTLKNSDILIHDGSQAVTGSAGSVVDICKYQADLLKRTGDFLIENTNITKSMLKKKERMEWFISAQVAKDLGIVDYIVGKDCSLVEII